jgi:hypothetical protein
LVGLTLGLFNVAGYVSSESPLPAYAAPMAAEAAGSD